jgi:hypothetical protein
MTHLRPRRRLAELVNHDARDDCALRQRDVGAFELLSFGELDRVPGLPGLLAPCDVDEARL